MKAKVCFNADKRTWSPSPLVGQIVLVTTLNADGQSNVAAKSWLSMVAFDPPVLALGCNLQHWTAQNILRNKEFVVNVPGDDLVDVIWNSSTLPHPRPVESLGLTPLPAQKVGPPLIEECRAHLECVFAQHLTFGEEVVLFGRIVAGCFDAAVLDEPDPYAYLRLPVFLEGGTFGVVDRALRAGQAPD